MTYVLLTNVATNTYHICSIYLSYLVECSFDIQLTTHIYSFSSLGKFHTHRPSAEWVHVLLGLLAIYWVSLLSLTGIIRGLKFSVVFIILTPKHCLSRFTELFMIKKQFR